MKNFKYDRAASNMMESLNAIIGKSNREELQFISILEVKLTKDLQDAKVYISSLEHISEEDLILIMKKNLPFIKKEFAKITTLRKIPNIIFITDNSLDNYNKIKKILAKENKKYKD